VRVLSVTHGPSVPGGVFEEVIEATGCELERWVVPLGGAPRAAERYDAVLVFGGSMHPDQDEEFDWLHAEAKFLGQVLEREIPALGVCLGAQLLARAAGARVRPSSAPEVGWHEIELTADGRSDTALRTFPARTYAFQWHHYTFDLPNGASELARSEVCTQAFRLGRAWGIQFHAEVTQPMIEAWLGEDPDDVADPARLRADTEQRIADWNELGRGLARAFLEEARA
jgi:GMP synthase (glutamine-hydrolysing)